MADVFELAVDGGEADVGDLVELLTILFMKASSGPGNSLRGVWPPKDLFRRRTEFVTVTLTVGGAVESGPALKN